jgi:crotonobetainyl-CoA:carnitine CoA-transferase CaiB-like acyl-CoA transferase
MTDSSQRGRSPLLGLRVVSLADDVLPWLSSSFVDLGADVDVLVSGTSEEAGESLRDLLTTRGKRIESLSHDTAEARRQLEGRLRDAQALLITPSSMSAVGCADPSEIRHAYPHLVVAVLTDFGLTGERKNWVGSELVYQALGGTLSRSGQPGRPPLPLPGELFLRSAAQELAWAVLTSVYRSLAQPGRAGAVLDCSIFEAGAACLDPAFGITGSGTPDTVEAYGRPDAANIYPIFRVRDGFVRLCLLAKGQWLAMRSWMGDPPDLMGDDLLTNPGRWAKNDLVVPMIADFLASMDCATVVAECRERRIPGAKVLSLSEVLTEEHYRTSGVLTEVGELAGRPVTAAEGMVCVHGRRQVPNLQLAAAAPSSPGWGPVNEEPGDYPLSGLTVLDLGVIVAGATVGQLFAQLGARVIRIENANFPDGMRRSFDWSTPAQARGHRGKESVGLDLRADEGRRIFLQLVAAADVVTSNFKPGTLERLGLSYDDMAAVNPRIVSVESSAFGDTGPWRTAMGYGPLVRAASGQTWLWREDIDSEYFADGITVFPDHLVGRVCAFAALACVLETRRTGRGARVTVAQCDVGLVQLAEHLAQESLAPGSVLPPGSSRHLLAEVLFPAQGDDQWCVVDPQTPEQLAALRGAVVGPGEATTEEAVAKFVSCRQAGEAAEQLQRLGVPAARMMRAIDMAHDSALGSRDWHERTEVAGTDHVIAVERYPVLTSDFPVPALAPMPLFGADTRAVLVEFGAPQSEVDALFSLGVAQQSAMVEDGSEER